MRWMLGTFEAGLFPGVNYYLSWCVYCSKLSVVSDFSFLSAKLNLQMTFTNPPKFFPPETSFRNNILT